MTSPTAKTIQIYLPTGEPRGIRIAEITTRIVQTILIPRSELIAGNHRPELEQPGVYFLFGEEEDEAMPLVYIGQTENALKRFKTHNKLKTFWKTAVFCCSKTQNFTQTHIRWLEWHCMQQAKQIGRYKLDNGQIPDNSTFVPEPMEAELLDLFETISMLISTLGYPVFDPFSKGGSAAHLFFCRGGGSEGTGELIEDGFVVFEGSKARIEISTSGDDYVRPRRTRLIESGIMKEQDGEYVFTQDYPFSSASSAAAVVLGRRANGWTEWKDEAGKTLSDVYRDTEASDDE